MKFSLLILFATALVLQAQDAAEPTVDLNRPREESTPATVTPSPIPTPEPTAPPQMPELSQLDEIYKKTTLGKAADESRIRIEMRGVQNQVVNDPEVVAARNAAAATRTDLEKRRRLQAYYEIYYGKMRARAGSTELKTAIQAAKDDHLRLLAQPKVRPDEAAALPTPTPGKNKDKDKDKDKKKKKSKFLPQS
jgi:hypothetical protein